MAETRVDLKGKIYTEHITKRDVRVIAATTHNIIQGNLHLSLDHRLIDEMNTAERFIAVTDAEVFDLAGKTRLYRAEFLTLNKEHVVWILPKENPEAKK
ncbi:MAG: hypothetical protein HY257_03910 [Chloroflexi bacterium]|nr:hypothetical protein [Chloroflexota bacterium]